MQKRKDKENGKCLQKAVWIADFDRRARTKSLLILGEEIGHFFLVKKMQREQNGNECKNHYSWLLYTTYTHKQDLLTLEIK